MITAVLCVTWGEMTLVVIVNVPVVCCGPIVICEGILAIRGDGYRGLQGDGSCTLSAGLHIGSGCFSS